MSLQTNRKHKAKRWLHTIYQTRQIHRTIPYLTLPSWWMTIQPPSAETTAWGQCITQTDLKAGRISQQILREETNGYYLTYPTKENALQGYYSGGALKHCIGQ